MLSIVRPWRSLKEGPPGANSQDDAGKTALMFAVENDDAAIVTLLLHKGAETSVRDAHAIKAADIARKYSHSYVGKMLASSVRTASHVAAKSAQDRTVASR